MYRRHPDPHLTNTPFPTLRSSYLFDPPFDLAKHACHVAGEVVLYQPLDGIGVFFQPVEQLVQHFCLVLGRSRLEQGELLLEPLEGDHPHAEVVSPLADRKSVVSGKSVSVRVDLGGRRIIKKKKKKKEKIT